ncbi:MAG TPA: hypothetical protein VNT77_06305 [Allosphingosinicella sp.]|nr:hypothetical protein [Allosphingosinicella sp.]
MADIALARRLFAPHYARSVIRHCGPRGAQLRDVPNAEAEPVAELQPGETFALLDVTAGWAWGYREADHRVGYLPAADLAGTG